MMEREQDENYMEECLRLGEQALASGNPPVGSIVVWDGRIVGEGVEAVKESEDVTDHAEIIAIRDAVQNGYKDKLPFSVLYSTHEPCIMCSYVIRQYKIPKIVYGVPVDHIGGDSSSFKILTTEKVPQWGEKPEIVQGVCRDECSQLNLRYRNKK